MRVLVTGGRGFIGKALIKHLRGKEFQIRSFSRNAVDPDFSDVEFVCGDLRNQEDVEAACEGIDVVFHSAAKVGLSGKYADFYAVNVEGSSNLIQACRKQGVKYFIFVSSASVVFAGEDIAGGNEDLAYPKKNFSNYAFTKAMAEQLVLDANGKDLKTISIRPHLVWGPGDQHIIPGIIERARQKRLWQVGDNSSRVDTTHIDNMVHALELALMALQRADYSGGKAYFVGNDYPVNVWDFIGQILSVYGFSFPKKQLSFRMAYRLASFFEFLKRIGLLQSDPPLTRFSVLELCKSHWFDLSNARNELNYHPVITYEQAFEELKKTVE